MADAGDDRGGSDTFGGRQTQTTPNGDEERRRAVDDAKAEEARQWSRAAAAVHAMADARAHWNATSEVERHRVARDMAIAVHNNRTYRDIVRSEPAIAEAVEAARRGSRVLQPMNHAEPRATVERGRGAAGDRGTRDRRR